MHAQASASQPATRSRSRIPILPRRPKWSFADLKQRFFFGGNSLKSAFIVALSGSFPPGEKEFIQSVRLFMNEVRDPKLIEDVQAFIAQEGQHSLQHRLLNEAFDRLGYAATLVSEQFEVIEEDWAQERSDADRLAVTVVMQVRPIYIYTGGMSVYCAMNARSFTLVQHSLTCYLPSSSHAFLSSNCVCSRQLQ